MLVTNGVYATGGRVVFGAMTNRVVVDKAITVASVNGPLATTIQGNQLGGLKFGDAAIRCVYLTNGAALTGFSLNTGATRALGDAVKERCGGGVWCESATATVSNCVISGNVAHHFGAGVFSGTLYNSRVISNVAYQGGGVASNSVFSSAFIANQAAGAGGGAFASSLFNSTIVANTANAGSGAYLSALTNCVSYYNIGGAGANYASSTLGYCCTTPAAAGIGNITNAPGFANTNGWADLRLQSNSPSINAGNNAYVTSSTDLDGNPRIAGGTVDMGAYEFQSPSSALSYAWAQQYGLPTDGSADFADTDNEGMDNWQEWRSGTVPTNAASALRIATVTNAPVGLNVSWDSVSSRSYWLERGGDLGTAPTFQTIATNIPGVTG